MRAHIIAKFALTLGALTGFLGVLAISLIAESIPEGSIVEVVPFKTSVERNSNARMVKLVSANIYTLE